MLPSRDLAEWAKTVRSTRTGIGRKFSPSLELVQTYSIEPITPESSRSTILILTC
jgi:hypothetical protein